MAFAIHLTWCIGHGTLKEILWKNISPKKIDLYLSIRNDMSDLISFTLFKISLFLISGSKFAVFILFQNSWNRLKIGKSGAEVDPNFVSKNTFKI